MPRNINSVMGFPPFRGAVRQIILASVAIYIVILLLVSFAPAAGQSLLSLGVLDPAHIRQGWLWQFVTYAFMYVDPMDFWITDRDLEEAGFVAETWEETPREADGPDLTWS